MLESPAAGTGGDTLVSSSVAAYQALSPRFRKRLEGLTAIHANHDGVAQERQNADAVMRRAELASEHPVVIVHPVTGAKALYVNPVYTKRIGTYISCHLSLVVVPPPPLSFPCTLGVCFESDC